MYMTIRTVIGRFWLLMLVVSFALLMGYSSLPVLGAVPVPTPDVETVPDLAELLTPTNTPFPTPTPATTATTAQPTATPTDSGQGSDSDGATPQDTASKPGQDKPTPQGPAQPAEASAVLTGTVTTAVLQLLLEANETARITDIAFFDDLVTVLGRSSDRRWWLVCCGVDKRQGWVLASTVQPNFDPATALNTLPVGVGANTVLQTTGGGETSEAQLQLEMRTSPAFTWSGQRLELHLVITNLGKSPASDIRLRDDLPSSLQYTQATADNQGLVQQKPSNQGGTIVTIHWSEIPAGGKVSAVITLRVAPDVAAGSLIDNLALVQAQNRADVSAGMTLAMPPTLMPQFQ